VCKTSLAKSKRLERRKIRVPGKIMKISSAWSKFKRLSGKFTHGVSFLYLTREINVDHQFNKQVVG